MTLNLTSTLLSRFSCFSSPHITILPETSPHNNTYLPSSPLKKTTSHYSSSFNPRASLSQSQNGVAEKPDSSVSDLLNDKLLTKVSGAKDANEALDMIGQSSNRNGGVISNSDCCLIIKAAIDRNNADLALSVFCAMRASFDQGVYTTLVQGLAASLRVSDALRMIDDICRLGVSPGEEVPFGKVVRCPSCMVAVAVAQPQHGIQIVSCTKCRYQYELVSGNINSIDSKELRLVNFHLELLLPNAARILLFGKGGSSIPAAVHSIVVQTPSGMVRTHRFATETVDLSAQEGERVAIAFAAPSSVYREVVPLIFSPKALNFYPGEPMCLTNHKDGRESLLLRAPIKDGNSTLLKPSTLIPVLAVLATGDAASGMIDPSLPKLLSVAAVASLAVGAT